MRQLSAGMMKAGSPTYRSIPDPGTKVRFVYDFLYEHRGRIVPKVEMRALADLVQSQSNLRERTGSLGSIINNLRDYWGCDIRSIRGGQLAYCFAGEWCGRVYVDYTRPAEAQADLPAGLREMLPPPSSDSALLPLKSQAY